MITPAPLRYETFGKLSDSDSKEVIAAVLAELDHIRQYMYDSEDLWVIDARRTAYKDKLKTL